MPLADRLGLDVPRGWWPTAPMLKGIEAAGFSWVHARTPPRAMLCERERLLRHAAALRGTLGTCGLGLVLFHVHDNLGARGDGCRPPGLDPLRLDLHLPPGGGRLAWRTIAEPMLERDVPIVLEVHPPHRPEPLSLLSVTTEALGAQPRVVRGLASGLAVQPG